MSEKKYLSAKPDSATYSGLAPTIAAATGCNPNSLAAEWQLLVLRWLDSHPEEAPEAPKMPTVTESALTDALTGVDAGFESVVRDTLASCLEALGVNVLPPTNVDRLAKLLRDSARLGREIPADVSEDLARGLDAAGVTAPGGENG